jgi:hypothetical protein
MEGMIQMGSFDIQASRNRLSNIQQTATQNHTNYTQGKKIQNDVPKKSNEVTSSTNSTTAQAKTDSTKNAATTTGTTNTTAGVKIDIQAMRSRLAKIEQTATNNHEKYTQGQEIKTNADNKTEATTSSANKTEAANNKAENTAVAKTETTSAAVGTTEVAKSTTGGKIDIQAMRDRLNKLDQTATNNHENYAQGKEIKNNANNKTEATTSSTNNTEAANSKATNNKVENSNAQNVQYNAKDELMKEIKNQIGNSPNAALNAQAFMNASVVSELLKY